MTKYEVSFILDDPLGMVEPNVIMEGVQQLKFKSCEMMHVVVKDVALFYKEPDVWAKW